MRRLTWLPFAVALFAFVLPFATVSCGQVSVEPTGADLVLRTPPETQDPDDPGIGRVVVDFGGGLATVAFLAFAFALVASARDWGYAWVTLAGFTGVAALVVLKMRGGGGGGAVVEVDAGVGGFLAGLAGTAGAVAVLSVWTRKQRVRANLPAAGLVAIVAGYIAPAWQTELLASSYADTLNVREPWRGLFWLLPIAAAASLVVRRDLLTRDLSTVALAVYGPTAVVTVHDLWRSSQDDRAEPGPGPFLVLLGLGLSGWFALRARRGPTARPARAPAQPARAPAAPPSGRSAPGSGGSPPGAP